MARAVDEWAMGQVVLPKQGNQSLISKSKNATQVPRSHQAPSFGMGSNLKSVSQPPLHLGVYNRRLS